ITLQWEKEDYNVHFILSFEGTETNISTVDGDEPVQITIPSLTAATTYTFTLFSVFENLRSSGISITAVTEHFYPISGTESSRSDDGSSPPIPLQRPFVYFGKEYNTIYVNHNGHLTFINSFSSYTPQRFPLNGSFDLIAPFWTDLDNRQTGVILYNQYTNGSVLQQATQDINSYFPNLNFNAAWVFVATWYKVPYFPNTGTETTFQAVLISGGQKSFVLMNYGVIASTFQNVQAGYDTINSVHHFTIPGSFSSSATGSNSTFSLSSNVNVAGRWAFEADSEPENQVINVWGWTFVVLIFLI
uniref:NIDO domain-containing protein n=1 Tax=Oryzias melastigma TaxID=30732 RepID=A0A3B3D2K1_ORYME